MGPRWLTMGSGDGSKMRTFAVCTVSPNLVRVIKFIRCAGHVARVEEGRSAFKLLTGKPTEKSPLGRPRRR